MADKNLRPHIIIKKEPASPQKREYEGGGGGTYSRTSYRQHSAKIYQEVDKLRAIFAQQNDGGIDKRYFKIEIPKDHKVETSDGKKIEANTFSTIVGSPESNIAHVSSSSQSFEDLLLQIEKYKTSENSIGKSKFALIESISEIPFEEKASQRFMSQFQDDNEEGEALLTIFSDLNSSEVDSVSRAIDAYLKAKEGEVLSVLPREEGTLIRVRSRKSVLRALAESFISVQSLDASDDLVVEMASVGEPIGNNVTVLPNSSQAYACLFDTGIKADNRFLQGSILEDYCPFGENRGVDTAHGTFVTSRIVYGDSIKDQLSSGSLVPDVKVLSVCINKFDELGNKVRITTDQLIAVMRDTVKKWHKQIRVYNLSISCVPKRTSTSAVIKDDFVHEVASEIDSLSRKYDVLFVICTGNIPHSPQQHFPNQAYPNYFVENESRMLSPGEAMLALTVGSFALEEAGGSMAKKEEPSPFTRRGPGFAGYHKPDLVAHGGNCGNGWSNHNFLNVAGFSDSVESISYGRGTSYSTPLVTRLAAKVFEMMPSASASMVKAMLVHFCSKPTTGCISDELFPLLHGHGFPNSETIGASNTSRQSYLYQGEMDFRDMIEIPFYVPKVLTNRRGKDKLKVSVTIAFYPETSSVLKKGYCKSHIRTKIVKIDQKNNFRDVPFSQSSVLDEERYSTVLKMEKYFSSGIGAGEWKVLIAHESRWTLRNPNTKFAIVITVEDPKNDPNIDIYSAIRTEIPNKYRAELGIKERIRI